MNIQIIITNMKIEYLCLITNKLQYISKKILIYRDKFKMLISIACSNGLFFI